MKLKKVTIFASSQLKSYLQQQGHLRREECRVALLSALETISRFQVAMMAGGTCYSSIRLAPGSPKRYTASGYAEWDSYEREREVTTRIEAVIDLGITERALLQVRLNFFRPSARHAHHSIMWGVDRNGQCFGFGAETRGMS